MTIKDKKSLLKSFPYKMIKKGEDYFFSGKVKTCQIYQSVEEKTKIAAIVEGAGDHSYSLDIDIEIEKKNIHFLGGCCSCPISTECKHIVATLLEAQQQLQEQAVARDLIEKKKSKWTDWVTALTSDSQEEASVKDHIIVYSLREKIYAYTRCIEVNIHLARILKKGGLGKFKRLFLHANSWNRYATPADASIVFQLQKEGSDGIGSFNLEGSSSGTVLEKILQTERAFWGQDPTALLKIAEMRTVTLNWELQNNGSQELKYQIEGGGQMLPVSPPWYIDHTQKECGLLQSSIQDANVLINAPSIAPDDILAFQEMIKDKDLDVPSPKIYEIKKVKGTPKLQIHLFATDYVHGNQWEKFDPGYPVISPHFLYDKLLIKASLRQSNNYAVDKENNEAIYELDRDWEEEKRLLKKFFQDPNTVPLEDKFTEPLATYEDCCTFNARIENEPALVKLVMEALDNWKKQGISIAIDPNFPYQCISKNCKWYLDTESTSQNYWFNLELGIEVDGKKVNALPILVSLIQHSPEVFNLDALEDMSEEECLIAKIATNQYIELPVKKVKRILSTLCELQDPKSLKNGKLQIPNLRAGTLLSTAEDIEGEWKSKHALKNFAKKLQKFTGIEEVTPPETLKTPLRPYQQEGLNWLQFLSNYQIGGILADDMGLGKTIQALAHLCIEKNKSQRPSLIIAPTSLLTNWKQEIEKFAPHMRVLTLHGIARKKHFSSIPENDIVFTTYPLVVRDQEHLIKYQFHALILDEAQVIKNAQAQCAKICRTLSAHHKICLTGTPMENHLEELWSLFDFINPGLLGSAKQFRSIFRNPIEKHGQIALQKSLSNRVAPFMLRRTKDLVAKDLPNKTEITQTIEIEGEQKKLYEGIRLAMHNKVNKALKKQGFASCQILILDALLKLRQVCCDPRLLKLDSAKKVQESAKFHFLFDMLEKLLEENRKILLFSSFTSMLKLIEEELIKRKVAYARLTGQTKDRAKEILSFQEGTKQLFLISLKAGGVGLNLTAADTVIHYDPWWNPAVENQATDRAYRIGQDKPIFVYRLITKNTVEEKILKLQEKKKHLVDQLFHEKSKSTTQFTLADMEDLFSPLSE